MNIKEVKHNIKWLKDGLRDVLSGMQKIVLTEIETYVDQQSKTISTDELRIQFEMYQKQFYTDDYFDRPMNAKYSNEMMEGQWDSWKQCAIINKISEER